MKNFLLRICNSILRKCPICKKLHKLKTKDPESLAVEAEGCTGDLGGTLSSLSLSLDGTMRGYIGHGREGIDKLFCPSGGSLP
jgi:hypothetical protein